MLQHISLGATRVSGSDNHVEYELKVGDQRPCWRRYREFDELAKSLKRVGVSSSVVFPPKRVFGNNAPAVIAERVSGLNAWLNSIIKIVPRGSHAGELVKSFLACDPWLEETPAVQNSGQSNGAALAAATISKTDTRLKEVINRFVSAASAPAQYTSLSKLSAPTRQKDDGNGANAVVAATGQDSVDLSEFRRSLEKAETIFATVRASKS